MERAFGVLNASFAVVRGPAKIWDPEMLWEMMTVCVIMQKFIVEDESEELRHDTKFEHMGDPIKLPEKNLTTSEEFIQMQQQISHRATHEQLPNGLVEHL